MWAGAAAGLFKRTAASADRKWDDFMFSGQTDGNSTDTRGQYRLSFIWDKERRGGCPEIFSRKN